ncbi:MAG TPA: phosphodiester glycosidase family protein [Candidatus Saccharimonadales bacterium]|nr:phosphodiester glycosidase family protein [Candidatus Saccharimonadales bacterium]
MKKLILGTLIIIIPLAIYALLISRNQSTAPEKSKAAGLESPQVFSDNSNSITIDNLTYSWFEVGNTDNLKLIPNFSEKLTSQEILDKEKCKFLSNSAFYSKANQPLGLVITGGKTISPWQQNSLFDGILSVNDMATPRITRNIPQDGLRIAIQVGPILKENSTFIPLKIIDDKEARRVIAAVTGSNKLVFIVIYDKNSEYSGPLLADVPVILKSFEQKSGIILADAINMDGGSASVFSSDGTKLSEFSPVGAFFCQL